MPTQVANFLAQHFRAPRPADVERDQYSNALLRSNAALQQNEVSRIPQRNQAEDLTIGKAQRENAAGLLGRGFTMAAASPRPKDAARAFISSPDFAAAGRMVGLPVDQFASADFANDADDAVRQQLQAWADALSGTTQQQRVQSTFVGKDGNQWIVTADGRTVNTGVPVSQFAQRPIETGAGIEAFDPARGSSGGPISPSATAPALDAAAQARKEAEALGAGRGQAQATFEAGAPQRTERARQQITNIDNLLSALDAAEKKVDWNTTGFVGNALKGVAGTPAHDLQHQLMTVQANLGFDRIQQMREASPTGGALGQVAVQELNALQASVAALAQSQSDPQLRDNLRKVRTHYENWKRVIQQAQGGLPDGVSEEDLQYTMRIHGLTREQVLERLRAR